MKLHTVRNCWQDYLKNVVPQGAHCSQIIETRRAFYGAFYSALQIFSAIGEPEVSEEEGGAILSGLYREAREFAATVGTEKEGE